MHTVTQEQWQRLWLKTDEATRVGRLLLRWFLEVPAETKRFADAVATTLVEQPSRL